MSGSIDGKVRIWNISGCNVVDWADLKDIISAVCYRPDGQGGIIGSLTGSCRFFNMSGEYLELDSQIHLHNKKKSSNKRITGFQVMSSFSPGLDTLFTSLDNMRCLRYACFSSSFYHKIRAKSWLFPRIPKSKFFKATMSSENTKVCSFLCYLHRSFLFHISMIDSKLSSSLFYLFNL